MFNRRPFAKTTSPVGSTVFPNMLLLCDIITREGAGPLRKRNGTSSSKYLDSERLYVRCLQFMFYDLSLSHSLFFYLSLFLIRTRGPLLRFATTHRARALMMELGNLQGRGPISEHAFGY